MLIHSEPSPKDDGELMNQRYILLSEAESKGQWLNLAK